MARTINKLVVLNSLMRGTTPNDADAAYSLYGKNAMLLDNSRLTLNPVLPLFTRKSYASAEGRATAKEGVRIAVFAANGEIHSAPTAARP